MHVRPEDVKEHKDALERFYGQYGRISAWTAKYPSYMSLAGQCRYERRNAAIMETAGNHPGYVLDIGCGVGDIVGALTRGGKDAVGLELSEVNMASCKLNAKGAILCLGMGECLPFRDCSFNVVILADVIEHVMDAESVMSEIRRVLKTSGVLILTTPNRRMTRFWILCDWPWRLASKMTKVARRTQSLAVKDELLAVTQVQALLTKGGFAIVEHKLIEFYPDMRSFAVLMCLIGETLRTRIAEPILKRLFARLERLECLNSRQFVVARRV